MLSAVKVTIHAISQSQQVEIEDAMIMFDLWIDEKREELMLEFSDKFDLPKNYLDSILEEIFKK